MLENLLHSRELTFQAKKLVSRLREAFNHLSKKSIRQSITGIDDRLDRPP